MFLSFRSFSSVSIVNFEHVNINWIAPISTNNFFHQKFFLHRNLSALYKIYQVVGTAYNMKEYGFSLTRYLVKKASNFIKSLRPATSSKVAARHRRFLVHFVEFLRTPFIIGHPGWLFLNWSLSELPSVPNSVSDAEQ